MSIDEDLSGLWMRGPVRNRYNIDYRVSPKLASGWRCPRAPILDKPDGEVNPEVPRESIVAMSWFDRPVLSNVEGLTTNGATSECSTNPSFALSLSKGGQEGVQRRSLWFRRLWPVAILMMALTGCTGMAPAAPPPVDHRLLYIGPQPRRWEEIVQANPLGPDDNIKGVLLLQQPAVSHFLVQIRSREQPHVHKEHDATIIMLSGRGRLVLKDRILPAQEGDVFFVPRGTPHYYVNDGPRPTVALAIFSPAYDGKDAVVVPFADRPEGAP